MSFGRSHALGLAAGLRLTGSTAARSPLSTRRVTFNSEDSCCLPLACTPRPGSAALG